jgi:glycosyltransferase involved in cell wall biosynthesis
MKGVSIIVCCHNSANRIVGTLKHLWVQETNGLPVEVVLVNNNCTDDTVNIAMNEWRDCGRQMPLKIVEEPIMGVSAARNKGVRSAKYEYAIFCDDDNWLASDYIRLAFDTMESNPGAGVLGGSSTAVSDAPFPDWFEQVKGDYAVGLQLDGNPCDASTRGYLWGAGMVVRKFVFEDLLGNGIANVLSDRKGKELSSGGDSEICKWFLMLGYSLWYNPNMKFSHFLEIDRLREEYYIQMKEKQNEAYLILQCYDDFMELFRLSFLERQYKYMKALSKLASNTRLSPGDEKALCLLYGRKIPNREIDTALLENLSLILRMKQ